MATTGNDSTGDGSLANPYLTIQKGISVAVSGVSTVIVRDGTYTGASNCNQSFLGKAITLKSEHGAASTVISCAGVSGPAFVFNSGEPAGAVLDGFTLTNGTGRLGEYGGAIYCISSSPTIQNCVVTNNSTGGSVGGGGGLYFEASSSHLENCVISHNRVFAENAQGGGVYAKTSYLTLTNCSIVGNSSKGSAGTPGRGGGFEAFYSNSTIFQNCLIQGNTAQGSTHCAPLGCWLDSSEGGGVDAIWSFIAFIDTDVIGNIANGIYSSSIEGQAHGGAMNLVSSYIWMHRCNVVSNSAVGTETAGGAIRALYTDATANRSDFVECLLANNSSGAGGSGCIYVEHSTVPSPTTLTNCTFSGNTAAGPAGAISNDGSLFTVLNCTFASNKGTSGAGGIVNKSGVFHLQNTLLSGNTGGNLSGSFVSDGYNLTSDASVILAGPGDLNNVAAQIAPLANNGGRTQTHALLPCSSAIDAGGGANAPAIDQRGVARPIDGNEDGSAAPDIGAYEFDLANTAFTQVAGALPMDIDLSAAPGTENTAVLGVLGKNAGDQLGVPYPKGIATGDINGDGYDDLIVGASSASPDGRIGAGQVYVIYGRANFPATLDLNTLADLSQITIIKGANASDGAGLAVATGDVNGDGFDDVIIGAHGFAAPAGPSAGATYVIYGSASRPGTAIDLADAPATYGGTLILGGSGSEWSGLSVASGDMNADGFDDVVIGAPDDLTVNGGQKGEVYVIYGGSGLSGQTLDLLNPAGTYGETRIISDIFNDHSGISVAVGDVNGDGYDDVIFGRYHASPGGRTNAGETDTIFGGPALPGAMVDLGAPPGPNLGARILGDDAGDQSGFSVACGDVDGDGYKDVVIGALTASPSGEAYVIYGSSSFAGKTVDLNLAVGANNETRILGYGAGATGASVAAGDLDGDGLDDVVVGNYLGDPAGRANAGEAYVIYGSAWLPGTVRNLSVHGDDVRILGGKASDQLGFGVQSGGDLNRDGFADLLASAPLADNASIDAGDNQAGSAVAVFGKGVGLNATSVERFKPGFAPRRGLGGRLAPVLRLRAGFDDGDNGERGASALTCALTHTDKNILNLGNGSHNDVADVVWHLTTDRTGWNSAALTFQYADFEVGGLIESSLRLYQASDLAGPWTLVPGQTINTTKNQISATASELGYFAIAGALSPFATPTPSVTCTPTPSPSPSATRTASPSATRSSTPTPTRSATPTPSRTSTPSPTPCTEAQLPPYDVDTVGVANVSVGPSFQLAFSVICPANPCGACATTSFSATFDPPIVVMVGTPTTSSPLTLQAIAPGVCAVTIQGCKISDPGTCGASAVGYVSISPAGVTSTATPTITRSSTPTPSRTATRTRTRSATLTPTPTPSRSATATASSTETFTPTQSSTPTMTRTASVTPTATRSSTSSPTRSSTLTSTRTATFTPSSTRTASRTRTSTATPSATRTSTLTPTPTRSATPSPSSSATRTATSTPSGTTTPSPTVTPSPTPSPTPFNAAGLNYSYIPLEMQAGQNLTSGLRILNMGNTTWSAADGFTLAVISDPQGILGVSELKIADGVSVAPWEIYIFSAVLQAPSTPGPCAIKLQMVQNPGQWFGPELDFSIDVVAATPTPNAARDWELYE